MSSQFVSVGNYELPGCAHREMAPMSRAESDRRTGPGLQAALIAIVDDDPWVRKSLERLIKSEGFRTETFASAEDFIRAGDHRETACLILDLRLPGMSGLELQHRLVIGNDHLPIVFVSAHDEPETRYEAMKAGAIAFFSKPFNDEALVDAVRSVVQ
ncbi:MAG TPA: response regulator [Candidatus Acidoferrum sp.]|nr:response regulator [Candidatus Acidoferrum sp.]